MTLAILNIDWAKKYKSKNHILKIEASLNKLNPDILIITESVDLNLPAYNFIYQTKPLPKDQEYEGLNYSDYLNGESANRVTIYSKYQSTNSFDVTDPYTSICKQFDTNIGAITIYATIIGTWFKKQPYAEKELMNCSADCMSIYNQTNSLCLAGDLNTSFEENKKYCEISNETTKLLKDLCTVCQMDLTTKTLRNNIDHIFLPKHLVTTYDAIPKIFVEKDVLSDHQGICLSIHERYPTNI